VKALLSRMMGAAAQPLLEGHSAFSLSMLRPCKGRERRARVSAASGHRLWFKLHLVHGVVTDAHEASAWALPAPDGDVVVVDAATTKPRCGSTRADRGVGLVVRLTAWSSISMMRGAADLISRRR